MKKYIKVYDDVLPPHHCKTLIEKFEASFDQHVATDLDNHRHFTEININQHKDWEGMVSGLYATLRPYVDRYRIDCKIKDNQWPDRFGFEQIRFKRYLVNNRDEFKSHVDVGDYESARRFLVFFLYLTNNDEGATVVEPIGGEPVVSPCKKGSVLVFPPFWNFPHRGEMPVKTPKYIVGSYLHYVNRPNHQRHLRDAN